VYISILKNRNEEHKIINEYGNLFSNGKIMPLIEIINLKIGRKEYNQETLINYYDENIESDFFIDYFAYDTKYEPTDKSKIELPIKIRTENEEEYLERLLSTTLSNKAIPVIFVKKSKESILSNTAIEFLILELQHKKDKIAVRLEAELFDDFYGVIKRHLRPNDYFFYDINESTMDPFIMDMHQLMFGSFNKILTYSPRERKLNNGSFLESGFTDLINCFAREEYKNYGFNGYADYAGLKDDLPKNGGNGKGAALSMIYNHENNKFYTITNHDTDLGPKGYKEVRDEMFNPSVYSKLDGDNCLAYKFVKERMIDRNKTGNFAQWNYITILRMLSEMKKVYRL